ncbi:hypothetical protein DL771_008088 [Monosporascus sp. 5C6A]|nr:hypothetical protein DL771_008088 [Monosporascus sp. 5C6A]
MVVLQYRMTRNTVFLAFGAAHLPADAPALCSIGTFLAQALLVWAAEGMLRRDKASLDPLAFAVIAQLSFQSGGQIVASRQLGFNEVPTNVPTGVYCGLFSDPHILAPWRENPKRNRRASAAMLVALGAIAWRWSERCGVEHGAVDCWRRQVPDRRGLACVEGQEGASW